jgi:CHAT domain-containing protein/tetratricopeptide (TPR) repeat protein
MGKGDRNRRKRRASVPKVSKALQVDEIVQELMQLESLEAFEELLAHQPSLLDPQVLAWFDQVAQDPHYGPLFASLAQLLTDARGDPADAWTTFDARKREATVNLERAERLQQEVQQAIDAREFDRVVRLADQAIPLAAAAGLGLAVASLEDHRGQALFQSSAPDRAERIEEAIAGYHRALAALPDGDTRAGVLMDLGLALGERVVGDHAENLDGAVDALDSALGLLSEASGPWRWAIMRTNLAWALLRRERGDRLDDLQRAERLCEEALDYRSLERDPEDWAHTQLNLGEVRARLFEFGVGDLEAVERTYGAVVEAAGQVDPWLVGAAEFMIGRIQRQRAHLTPQEFVTLRQSGNDDVELVDTALVESAYRHLGEAVRLVPADRDAIRRGHTLSEFSAAAQELGFDTEAIEAAREALTLLTPESDLRGCAAVGKRLGSMLCTQGAYQDAAAAFRLAIRAVDLGFFSRLDTEGREVDIRSAGNVYRWASFAIAKAGDPLEAALVLETGSARELRRRLTSLDLAKKLDSIPAGLREEYELSARMLAAAPFGAMSADAARRLQEAIEAIRALPEMEGFASAAVPADLVAATEPGWPLVYVNPTPFGTVILAISRDEGVANVEATFLDTTSMDVFNHLSLGAHAVEPTEADAPAGSYIMGAGAAGNAEVADQLDLILPWLGDALIGAVAQIVDGLDANGVTIVPYGPLATAPLHAAEWSSSTRLLDTVPVRYSPSAAAVATALDRVRTRAATERCLVAVADPFGDLLGARPEAEYIAQDFFPHISVACGSDATTTFLAKHAETATDLHLACHAYGGLFDEKETALLLSDGAMSLLTLSELHLSCRVCVASACQTALASLTALPQEGLSLATVVLSAGSACAVASLWPVDDGATAVLMVLLYDQMLSNALRPPEALQGAQLALQRLTFSDLEKILSRYPDLRPALRISGHLPAEPPDPADTPFAHPFLWAGFVAVGV